MRTRIKLCGLKTANDIASAVEAGADALGFVFYPKSKRHITLETATLLRPKVPAMVSKVALMVNPTTSEVKDIILHLQPDVLQFHGSESESFCAQFDLPYMKALAVNAEFDLLNSCVRYPSAAALLLDTPSEGHGGSGKTFPWHILPALANAPLPVVLSGGLTPQNVSDAIRLVKPYAVDVSSGIESAPGQKSAPLMSHFCRAVMRTDHELYHS